MTDQTPAPQPTSAPMEQKVGDQSVTVIVTADPLNPTPGLPAALPPIEVPPGPAEQAAEGEETGEVTQEEVNAAIEAAALEAQEVAQSSAKVDLQFPAIGFIDPVMELEKMRRLTSSMPDDARRAYPDQIRSKLLAHHANPTEFPNVTDEELALAIFIKRTTDSPLTEEDLEAKATGKAPKKAKEAKPGKPAKKTMDDILKGL